MSKYDRNIEKECNKSIGEDGPHHPLRFSIGLITLLGYQPNQGQSKPSGRPTSARLLTHSPESRALRDRANPEVGQVDRVARQVIESGVLRELELDIPVIDSARAQGLSTESVP
jgi:hypothetical protein